MVDFLATRDTLKKAQTIGQRCSSADDHSDDLIKLIDSGSFGVHVSSVLHPTLEGVLRELNRDQDVSILR